MYFYDLLYFNETVNGQYYCFMVYLYRVLSRVKRARYPAGQYLRVITDYNIILHCTYHSDLTTPVLWSADVYIGNIIMGTSS